MAKQSSTAKFDPATLAFSAVENALKDSVLSDSETSPKKKFDDLDRPAEPAKKETRKKVAKKIASKSEQVANDQTLRTNSSTRNDSSKYLYKLQAKASSAPLWIAAIFSLLWFGAVGVVAWLRFGEQITNIAKLIPFMKTIEFTDILAIAFLPIFGFFAIAILIRKASELRNAAKSMTQAAIMLTQPESNAADKIATVSQAVRREVNALGDGLERALSRAGELEVMVHNEVRSLENTYSDNETRLRGLIEELAAQRESVVTNSDRVRDAIAEAHTMMLEDMDRASGSLSNSLLSNSSQVQQSLESATLLLDNTFGEKSENFISLMDNKTTDLISAIDMNSENLNISLDEKLQALNENFENATISMSQSIEHKSQELGSTLRDSGVSIIAQLETSSKTSNTALEAVGARIVGDISKNSQLAEKMISDITNRVDETLSTKFNTMDSSLNTSIIQIAGAVDEATSQARNTLDSAGDKTLSAINSRIDEVSLILSSRLQEIDEIVGTKGEKIISSLSTHTIEFKSNSNLLELALDEKTSLLNKTLTSQTKNLSGFITENTKEFTKTIDAQTSSIRSHTDNSIRSISEVIDLKTIEMGEVVNTRIKEINHNIGTSVSETISSLTNAETGLNARIELSAKTIQDSTDITAAIIESGVDSARQSIVKMVDERLGTLPEAITARADITADRLTALSEDINSSISQSMSDLEVSATKIEETIGSSLADASLTISKDVEQSAARMDIAVRTALGEVKEAARHIEDLVEVRALETAKSLGKKVEEMNKALTSQTNNFANIIEKKSKALDVSLKNHGNVLSQALSESSIEAEKIMSSSTGRILDDVNDALKKLNDGNLLLQRVLETSTSNLAELETSVANQTSTYSDAVREAVSGTKEAGLMVSEHVNALQTTISSVTSEFGSIINELNSETNNIKSASNALDDAGSKTINNLAIHEDAMRTLAQSFSTRADDIDQRMRAFAQNISSTVNETEGRLETARTAMDETLKATTISVANRLDKFTDAADQQGRAASEQMQNTQASLVREMNSALEDATSRFNETANAMRITAHQVNEELEATRAELSRNVTELPEETRASAAAMRRVVAEQIEALNELNSIVRTQHKTHDMSAKRPIRQERNIDRGQERSQSEYKDRQQDRRQAPDFLKSGFNTNNQPSASVEITPTKSAVAELLRNAKKPEQTAPKAIDSVKNDSDNWLRDVLHNASSKQEESKQNSINLSSLTQEISQSMDKKELAEAWKRYQAGEDNVFSRRIYTLSGQSTYDALRKRLHNDTDFTRNSSEYISEFESFLAKSIKDPNLNVSALDLLNSDRGKVYTMLAHAGGHLN